MKIFKKVLQGQNAPCLGMGVLFFLVTASAQAGPSLSQIAKENLLKKKMTLSFVEKVKAHEAMSLDEIRADYRANWEKEHEFAKAHRLLSNEVNGRFEEALRGIESFSSKEDVLRMEKKALEDLNTADNLLFSYLRKFYGRNPPRTSAVISIFSLGTVPALLFALDIATLPAALVISCITGW